MNPGGADACGPAASGTVSTSRSAPTSADPRTESWFRVEIRAERLDWLPAVLASLDRPFVIERPAELRDLVLALAERLTASASES